MLIIILFVIINISSNRFILRIYDIKDLLVIERTLKVGT